MPPRPTAPTSRLASAIFSRIFYRLFASAAEPVEPLAADVFVAARLLLASAVTPAMPYLLSFAAGAMLYVVIEELIPETSQGAHSNIGTIGFALGFALMMVLDVVMG